MLLCLMSIVIQTNAQDLKVNLPITPNQVVAIAEQELPNMLQLIAPDQIKNFGFDLTEDFANVKIGRPFYVVSLPRTEPIASKTIQSTPHTIALPLILDCTARCLLYVSQENGAWKAVGIGEGSLVASQIDVFSTSTDEDGSSQVIIDVPHMKQRYLMEDNDSFKPLFRSQNYNMKMKGISLKELMIVNNNQAIEANNVDHK